MTDAWTSDLVVVVKFKLHGKRLTFREFLTKHEYAECRRSA